MEVLKMEKTKCPCCNGTGFISEEELEDYEYYYGFLNKYPVEERGAIKAKLSMQGLYYLPDEKKRVLYSARAICELATEDSRIITENKLDKTLKAFISHLIDTDKYNS
jgi:hypothetical protein